MAKDLNRNQTMSDSENTVVGVYDNYADAKKAVDALVSAGFSWENVQLNPEADSVSAQDSGAQRDAEENGSGIGGFFSRLFGMDDERPHHDVYAESVRRGHTVLTVDVRSQEEAERASDIMTKYNAVDIDERASHWRSQGWNSYDASAPRYTDEQIASDRSSYLSSGMGKDTKEARIPVVEENIDIGKRKVDIGGVRVFTRVRETPVNESVNLREEHVKVERRPVDKKASQADMAAFKEGSIEMREQAEEAVVGKSARIVEEVVVGKETTQRTEKISDTVRRTDVEVEQLGASGKGSSRTGGDDSEFRTHWQSNFGSSGGRYEDYAPAYSYGSSMANNDRYRNAQWDDVEPQLRTDWEARHPESKWDKVKDAVRFGTQSRQTRRP